MPVLPRYIVPLDMKWCICHFTKCHIQPFIFKGGEFYVAILRLVISCIIFTGFCVYMEIVQLMAPVFVTHVGMVTHVISQVKLTTM